MKPFFKKILILSLFLFGFSANAQSLPQIPVLESAASFRIEPSLPGANTDVTIFLEGYVFSLDTAQIVWYVNDKEVLRGTGEKILRINTGEPGTSKVVSVVITSSAGVRVERSVSFYPADVDILWEAETYTPPFYKGRKLYSTESTLILEAVPDFITTAGSRLPPSTLVYTWSKNGQVLGNLSGYGKRSIKIVGSLFEKREKISVRVESSDGKYRARKEIQVAPTNPEILFYANNPLYGVLYSLALPNQFRLEGEELSLVAAPYFFGSNTKTSPFLNFSWLINGNSTKPQSEDASSLTLRREGETRGTARISLSIENTEKILQAAKKEFLISFGQ